MHNSASLDDVFILSHIAAYKSKQGIINVSQLKTLYSASSQIEQI
jgi:hypothetical protein